MQRFYTGGLLLDKWQRLPNPKDSFMSEEFLVSTIEYMGPQKDVPAGGVSRVALPGGGYATLKDLIARYPVEMLGRRYAAQSDGHAGVMARVCDSAVRLVVQVHPTGEDARQYFHAPAGKTEVWHVLDCREIDGQKPHVYAGFKPHVTQQIWRDVFERQDIPAMLACMHRIEVETGDTVVIEAGTPHAMGPGCLILELHEPCDYTIRLERNFNGQVLADGQMHYGLGFDRIFEFFRYGGVSEEAFRAKAVIVPKTVQQTEGGTLEDVFTYKDTPRFCAQKVRLSGTFALPEFDGHRLLVGAKGDARVSCGNESFLLPQGRGMFLPAVQGDVMLDGDGEVIVGYPFKIG